MLELNVIASGSKGNCAIVRDTATGRSVLVDCGVTKREFMSGCEAMDVDPESIEGVLITHEHSDHTKGLGVVMRGLDRLGCNPPLFTRNGTRAASKPIWEVSELSTQYRFDVGTAFMVAGLRVLPFETSHDAASPAGFRFESSDGDALGYMTDTGVVTAAAHEALRGVRILGIESNHDITMLREGPYPRSLQDRILSETGHLSNKQCAEEVAALLHPGLEQIVALHISENNNTFGIPKRTIQAVLDEHGHGAQVRSALPHTPMKIC